MPLLNKNKNDKFIKAKLKTSDERTNKYKVIQKNTENSIRAIFFEKLGEKGYLIWTCLRY